MAKNFQEKNQKNESEVTDCHRIVGFLASLLRALAFHHKVGGGIFEVCDWWWGVTFAAVCEFGGNI